MTKQTFVQAPRAAIYCRVSRDEQAENWSLPTQEAACRKYAEDHGYEIVGVWREDFTGTQISRPEMNRVMLRVSAREIDVVICFKIDRLSRGGVDQVGYFKTMFGMSGARFESVTEPNDNSSMGQVLSAIYAGSASHEVENTRERTNRGLRAKAKAGKAIGRARPPFGLRYKAPLLDGDGKPIKGTVNAAYEEDPATVEHLKWMFQQSEEGASLRGLSKQLTELGVKPPYSDRTGSVSWNPASVRHIITNPCYTGEAVQFAVKVEKHPDPKYKTRRVRRPIDPDGDGAIPVPPGVFPIVIDKPLFDRVQRRLSQNKRESQRADRDPEVGILRRGIARCGHCNSALAVDYNRTKNSDGKEATYGCQWKQRERYGCPRCNISTAKLDREVWSWITAIRDDTRLIEVFADRLRSADEDGTKSDRLLELLNSRVGEIDEQRTKLAKRLALVDDDTAQLVADQLKELADQRRALVSQRERASVKAEAEVRRRQRVARAVDMITGISEPGTDLDTLSYHEKRRILFDLGAVIHVYPNGHTPRWGMTLAFDNDRSRIRVVGDENISVVWDENTDFEQATFYLSSIRRCANTPGCTRCSRRHSRDG